MRIGVYPAALPAPVTPDSALSSCFTAQQVIPPRPEEDSGRCSTGGRLRYYRVMREKTEYLPGLALPGIIVVAAVIALLIAFAPEISIAPVGPGSAFLLAWIALHFAWALSLTTAILRGASGRDALAQGGSVAEGLFFLGAFLFLFAYIFALNANMDYVQRFIESGGNLQLALDTRTERLIATARFAPLMLLDLAYWILSARFRGVFRAERTRRGLYRRMSPVLVVLAVMLSVLAQPSALRLEGISILGWISLVPLFVVLRLQVEARRPGRAIWYGVLYGVLFTLVGNFWLGTFNLVSLQAVGLIFFGFYLIFMPLVTGALHVLRDSRLRFLVLPLAWTSWELFRSSGFLGYPWLLVAHSQYRILPLIQIAELGGVWLVSFVVLLVNSLLTEMVLEGSLRRHHVPLAAVVALAFGTGMVLQAIPVPSRDVVRLALIQQNSDPRKHEYIQTLDSLRELTDKTLPYKPDMVVWSETAFVPNIRRWSEEDPRRYSLARLVREFLAYLDTVDTWLITGNDDYSRVMDEDGQELERHNYNAAVLFDPRGERRETYHKIKLVPFTEYFPFEEQLPMVYNMLLDFDVAFWTPGTERTVFEHPRFRFSTPICFEDVFPREVRAFAREGMEVVVNLTNDYWSLQEVAAQQHFVAALFRTVELRRPMVRSTASGVTSHIDAQGRIIATVPQYSEQYLIADVEVPDGTRSTLYERWGDWFPWFTGLLLLLLVATAAWGRREQGGAPAGDRANDTDQ